MSSIAEALAKAGFALEEAKAFTNAQLEGMEAWEVALYTFLATSATYYAYGQLTHKVGPVPFCSRCCCCR